MKKVTVLDFKRKKELGEKITMLTAYDFPMARLIDAAGIDAVLVGDSLGMVLLGYGSTLKVTMDDMIHHVKAVRNGVESAFLIGDMPFMSYQSSDEDAVRNAGRFVKEGGAEAVKVEGGESSLPRMKAIIGAGIPVLGHLGLLPQSVNASGGYKVQGRSTETAEHIIADAVALEKSGCFALVLECVPRELAKKITRKIGIPTIGIGAGPDCDGQVLVTHDIIGYQDKTPPKFVKQYANIAPLIKRAVESFRKETLSGEFPDEPRCF
ncbi:MAG: 3-methyl-2-oxobutanoate hydroxymethyltransferase [Candidatus Omnitrophota bacterium]|nr:3-methyl-2-oxobutanoate hydroxymethyltransferase [Candidatus Omnitrophota bacterium]